MTVGGVPHQIPKSRYHGVVTARQAFAAGQNVSAHLRTTQRAQLNDPSIIEISYDLQAGSYTAQALDDLDRLWEYGRDLANVLGEVLRHDDVLLDAGAGECTSLVATLNQLPRPARVLAFDISWSRMAMGRRFARRFLTGPDPPPELFVADIGQIPLRTQSVDVTMTVHALEPNGGNELPLLRALLQVTRRYLVLFEPSYERATPAAQARMAEHGYVRNLEDSITAAGGVVEAVLEMPRPMNALNPTYAYVVRAPLAPGEPPDAEDVWECPVTHLPLRPVPDGLWCADGGLLYPSVLSIPIVRPEHAILASLYESELASGDERGT